MKGGLFDLIIVSLWVFQPPLFMPATSLTLPQGRSASLSTKLRHTHKMGSDGTKAMNMPRTQNPTRSALEKNIAALENAKFGFAFASGMSAIDASLKLVKAGDHVILGDNTYGGTYRLFSKILANYGVEFDLADTSNVADLERAFKPNTKMVFVETPTNPIMTVTDLQAVSSLAACKRGQSHL